MRLTTDEFIRRFLLHVLPRDYRRFRNYGLVAIGTRKTSLVLACRLLDASPGPQGAADEEPVDPWPPCPCYGGRMVVIEVFEHRRQPRAPPTTRMPNWESVMPSCYVVRECSEWQVRRAASQHFEG